MAERIVLGANTNAIRLKDCLLLSRGQHNIIKRKGIKVIRDAEVNGDTVLPKLVLSKDTTYVTPVARILMRPGQRQMVNSNLKKEDVIGEFVPANDPLVKAFH